jgi:hypothetical protein
LATADPAEVLPCGVLFEDTCDSEDAQGTYLWALNVSEELGI